MAKPSQNAPFDFLAMLQETNNAYKTALTRKDETIENLRQQLEESRQRNERSDQLILLYERDNCELHEQLFEARKQIIRRYTSGHAEEPVEETSKRPYGESYGDQEIRKRRRSCVIDLDQDSDGEQQDENTMDRSTSQESSVRHHSAEANINPQQHALPPKSISFPRTTRSGRQVRPPRLWPDLDHQPKIVDVPTNKSPTPDWINVAVWIDDGTLKTDALVDTSEWDELVDAFATQAQDFAAVDPQWEQNRSHRTCVSSKFSHSHSGAWTLEDPTTSCCKTCYIERKFCVRYSKSQQRFELLPLPKAIRGSRLCVGRFIREGRFETSPLLGLWQ